jgi:hypothetical protein
MDCALVFRPFSLIEKTSESSLHQHARELFDSSDTSVYYGGTFICLQISTWFPERVNLPSNIVSIVVGLFPKLIGLPSPIVADSYC